MAAGLPVVATRVGGIPEIVTAATGLLVPPLDPHRLADALVKLTDDAERRAQLGAGARARFLSDYEAVGWAERLAEVYSAILK
jgi:glycosyltransferase involved in cell wall biosynthesis